MILHVRVWIYHIRAGTPYEPWNCPIALALKSEGCYKVSANKEVISFVRVDPPYTLKRYTLKTPDIVARFIDRFDRDWDGEPFDFELDLDKQFSY